MGSAAIRESELSAIVISGKNKEVIISRTDTAATEKTLYIMLFEDCFIDGHSFFFTISFNRKRNNVNVPAFLDCRNAVGYSIL